MNSLRGRDRVFVVRARRVARWCRDPLAVLGRMARVAIDVGQAGPALSTAPVARTVVVASEVRTGSTMLCELLRSTDVCGDPQEFLGTHAFEAWGQAYGVPKLNRSQVAAQWWRRVRLRRYWNRTANFDAEEIRRYLDDVMRRRTSSNGVFAINIHWHQWVEMRKLGLDESLFRGEVTWVHLWRQDVVAQAVSALRALQTDTWRSNGVARARPEEAAYDEMELDRYVDRAVDGYEGWKQFFTERGVQPLEVTYEQMVQDRRSTVIDILEASHLGDDDSWDHLTIEATTARQSTGLNAQWAARYRRDHPSAGLGPARQPSR
ncbi:MAG: Stf0 family sulfotransferase [Ilumatobacter sp.]